MAKSAKLTSMDFPDSALTVIENLNFLCYQNCAIFSKFILRTLIREGYSSSLIFVLKQI